MNGQPFTLDANGQGTVVASVAGAYVFNVISSDGSASTNNTASAFASDASESDAPVVSFISPDAEGEVTAPTAIIATITDANLARWQLHLATGDDDPSPRLLASGTSNVTASAITTLDPSMMLNGFYQLRLTATDTSGLTGSDRRAVRIDGDLKLGHFSLSFLEAEVPLVGFPIRITRTYDTRQSSENLDFGYGWSIDYQNVRVRESRKAGFAWSQTQEGGPFGQWCIRSNGAREVTVTLPDGDVETFRAKFNPECSGLTANVSGTLVFDPVGDTRSTLEQTDYGTVQLINTGNGPNLADPGNPSVPVDPQHYQLKTAEGLVYVLDQNFGIQHIADQHDNVLSFTRDGIVHSSGVSIPFTRDSVGRITRISLPDGQTLRYRYDANGDLIESRDQIGYPTAISYLPNPRYPHWLEEIRDPLGRRAIKNVYDANGRLERTIDAEGKEQVFTHSLATHTTSVKNRLGHTTTYGFDDAGNIVSETNALNETTTRTYDDDGNELTVTDPLDRTTTRTYDTRGNVLTETNDLGETVTRTYNAANQLLTETDDAGRITARNTYWVNQAAQETAVLLETKDALDHVTKFDIDTFGDGSLRALEDANGARTEFVYDGHGNVVFEKDAEGHITQRSYDPMGRVLSESQTRVRSGQTETMTTTHRYDAKGQLIETVAPNGDVSSRTYDANGRVTVETSAAGSTFHEYDPLGREIRTIHPDQSEEFTFYDAEGNVIEQRDRMGRATRMVYDKLNRLVETIYPDADVSNGNDGDHTNNPRTKSDYDEAGQLIASWDELDRPTEYEYDDAGRQITVTDALGNSTHSVYDDTGRRIATIDALGRETKFVYDAAGRMIETILPDADADDGNDANNPRIRMAYDATGKKISETDPSNRTTQFKYDDRGQLIEVIQPGALSTTYGYDEQGRKITQTDAEGRTTRWSYDKLGRTLSRTLPMGQSEQFRYNDKGQLAAKTDFNGQMTQYTYDSMGNRTRTEYPDGGVLKTTYNKNGEPLTIELNGEVETRTYDTRGRLKSVLYADGQRIDYEYDKVGNRTKLTTMTRVVDYGFDALNRLATVTEQPSTALAQDVPRITRYGYTDVGSRDFMEYPNGTRVDYSYNRRNQLTTMLHKKAATVLLGLSYLLNPDGSRASIIEHTQAIDANQVPVVDTNGSPVLEQQRRTDYTYDDLKRLVHEVVDARVDSNDRTTSWTYDDVGNRQTQSQQSTVNGAATTETIGYTYDANDRLLSETKTVVAGGNRNTTATTHRYDLNGNLLETSKPNSVERYRWNRDGRLTQHEKTTNGTTAITQYAYTADGIRNRITANANTPNAITTRQLIDPVQSYAQVLEETIAVGAQPAQLKAVFTHGDDLIAQHALKNSDGTAATSGTSYLHYDGLGTTRLLTNASGNVTDRYAYQAFGDLDEAASSYSFGSSAATDYLFTGEQFDPNLGFYYLRARYMNPNSGRFVSMDSWKGRKLRPATLHKFAYGDNNPAFYVDPSGHMSTLDVTLAPSIASIMRGTESAGALITASRIGARLIMAFGVGLISGSSAIISNPRSKQDARDQLRDIVIAKALARVRNGNTLYHYTSAASATEIMATQTLKCTPPYRGHLGGGITYPAGAYATDIAPWDPFTTQRMLGILFFGGNQHRDLTWFAAIDGDEFNPVYGSDNQFVRQCIPGDFIDVEVFYIGPSLLDP